MTSISFSLFLYLSHSLHLSYLCLVTVSSSMLLPVQYETDLLLKKKKILCWLIWSIDRFENEGNSRG